MNNSILRLGELAQVYEEKDDTFIVNVSRTEDFQHLFIGSYSTLTTEFRFKSADNQTPFEIFIPRQEKHEYYPETAGNGFYLKTNLDAKNFKIVFCPENARSAENWQIIQEHDEDILIEDFEVFDSHLIVQEKKNGLSQLRAYDRSDYSNQLIPPTEETYTLYLGMNPEFNTKWVRIGYSSLTTPHTVYDINLDNFERKLIKQTPVFRRF